MFRPLSFAMVLGSCTTRQSLCVNSLADIPGEQNKLAGARSHTGSNKAPIPLETPTPALVPPSVEDLFTKFIKVFIETI